MIDYTLQIDTSGGSNPNGFFTIGVIQVAEMASEYVDDNPRVERRGFGEIEVENEPFEYAKLGGDRYKLYDIIKSVAPNQEVWLKFVSAYETLYAYFGIIDCKLDDDEKKITIKPYILDQYTDLLENRENEVKVFDETNQIVNGDFKEWTGNVPNGWTLPIIFTPIFEKVFFNDSSAISISNEFVLLGDTSFIVQSIPNAIINRQLSFSFYWALTGSNSNRENLKYKIELLGSINHYDLDLNGKWIPYDADYRNTYQNQALPIDQNSAQYTKYAITSDKLPETGIITIWFYLDMGALNDPITKLILSNIIVSTSTIELKTIKIELTGNSLVSKNEDAPEVIWANRKPKANFYSTKIDYQQTLDYFFDGNGKPIEGNLIMSDDNGFQIKDIIQFFQEQASPSYKFELSSITIFKCEYIAHKKRRFRAICEFSREEIYYEKISDGNGGYLPPEADSGWFNTFTTEQSNGNRYLWVRTPYNGISLPWIKSAIDTGNWREYNSTFGYYDSIKSVKQYPTSLDKSVEINNAIDLRELFNKVYRETHISLRGKNVYSNFLWNDDLSVQETTDVYINNDVNTNYVTMTDQTSDVEPKNELNKIAIVHTYEFSTDPTTDKEKTILKITFQDLMADFLAHFPQCYWFIDANKDLHIEHIKYFDRVNKAKDLTVVQYSYIRKYEKWEYIKDKLYSLEKYIFKNSGNIDFTSSEVLFEKIASNKRGQDIKLEVSSKVLSTDLAWCLENRNGLDNGIVLIQYDTVNDINACRKGIGQNTKESIINGDLSSSSLLAKYATYEGTWERGKINGKGRYNDQDGYYQFSTTKYIRQGEEITMKGVFLDKIILTNLGLGIITQRKVDYENNVTKVVANYRYADKYVVMSENVLIDFGEDIPVEKTLPEVVTDSNVESIDESSAMCSGTVLTDGNDPVTERGIVYALVLGQTNIIDGTKVISGDGLGNFSVLLSGLDSVTLYWFRAYAINSVGVKYGNGYKFNTL